jgi:hypothetical protein
VLVSSRLRLTVGDYAVFGAAIREISDEDNHSAL